MIGGPADGGIRRGDDTEGLAMWHSRNRVMKGPNFMTAYHRFYNVTLEGRLNSIKALTVVSAAHERYVLRMRPT